MLELASEAAFRDGNTWKVFMGVTDENRETYQTAADFAHAPADEAWVYSCVRVRYAAVSGVPLRVYVRKGRDLSPAEDEDDADGLELAELLTVVNPSGEWNGGRLKAFLEAGNAVWGGSYLAKVRGRLGGRPRELWWLDVPHTAVQSASGREADNYVYTPPKGGRSDYRPENIVAFRTVNLEDPLTPLSPLSSARNDVAVSRYAAIHTASTLRNDGIPRGAWVPQKGAIIEPSQKRSLISVLRGLRGPKNAGKTPFLNAEVEYKQLALNPKDADWIAARKASRMTVAAAIGVPLPLAGDWEGLSQYSVLRDAVRFLWHQTLIPDLDGIADVINDRLTPDFDPTRRRLVVGFDYSQIEALQPTYKELADVWLRGVEDTVVVPDEARTKVYGLKSRAGGDKPTPKISVTLRPADVDPAIIASLLDQTESDVVVEPGETAEPGGVPAPEAPADADALRAFGKALYKQAAVRAFTSGGALDAASLLGHDPTPAVRTVIEAGLRARRSAAQIAEAIKETP